MNPYCIIPWDTDFEIQKKNVLGEEVKRNLKIILNPKNKGAGMFDEITISYEDTYVDIYNNTVFTPLETFAANITYRKENGTEIKDYEEKNNLGNCTFTKISSAYTINYIEVELIIVAEGRLLDHIFVVFSNVDENL